MFRLRKKVWARRGRKNAGGKKVRFSMRRHLENIFQNLKINIVTEIKFVQISIKNDDGGVPPIDGQELKGKYILEIPASNKNLSNIEHYKKIAEEYGVTLRFREE